MTAGRTNKDQKSVHWCTPPKYADAVMRFFNNVIDLDPCSNPYSLIRARVCLSLPDNDGLKHEWAYRHIFVNPPYGKDRERDTSIKDWLCKCCLAHEDFGSEVLALIPVATNTSHWKQYVFGHAKAVCFLHDTRLRFMLNGKLDAKGAPMACAMVYWGNNLAKFRSVFSSFGAIMT